MNGFYSFMQILLPIFISLMVVALGGLISERSGVTNIALEGFMIFGGWIGVIVMDAMLVQLGFAKNFVEVVTIDSNAVNAGYKILIFLVSCLAAGALSGILSLIHAYSSISLNCDQTISATAINTLAPAFCLFLNMTLDIGQYNLASNGATPASDKIPVANKVLRFDAIPGLSEIPGIGDIFFKNAYPSFFLGILILIGLWFFLYHTKAGKHVRACGENPYSAAACGINVKKVRYLSVMASGFLGGVGGFFLLSVTTINFDGTVAGYGFLALAVLIFGAWKPFKTMLAALFFSFFTALASGVSFFPAIEQLKLDPYVYNLLPYLFTLLVLILSSKKSRAPEADGLPYLVGKR